jgi:hypothetical protein|tara:strand:+ start:1950 stop:2765 length:816 start_codon:yes stop_codon:yes gene_type:complete
MTNLKTFCLSLNPAHNEIIKYLGYTPVGLGDDNFSKDWLTDKTGENIALKNPYYGEYTFHYWLWKNNKINFEGWVGFCQYRKFWKINSEPYIQNNLENLKNIILKEIPANLESYESIIGEDFFVNQFRFSKFIKHNFKTMALEPSLFFNKKKRTIKFHFDMMHGHGNLDKAISVLNKNERKDFFDYVNSEVSFNPHNMFICKNKEILYAYYESLFPWLFECEKIFGFKDLKGFGLKRIYGFLAERYMSYWFKKYTKYAILPIQFKDVSDFL